MTDRPIIFSAPMVRALLAGIKSQTRRVVKPVRSHPVQQPRWPYGQVGDRLWVKETWAAGACVDALPPSMLDPNVWQVDAGGLWYPADASTPSHPPGPRGRTRVSIHMPRWASRITLEIHAIRRERLHAISRDDALAEGFSTLQTPQGQTRYGIADATGRPGLGDGGWPVNEWCSEPVEAYRRLWEKIHGAGVWETNPDVWVVGFRKV